MPRAISPSRGVSPPPSRTTSDRKVCVYCGYRGLSIQLGGEATRFCCPSCGGDLYSRPALSYAEMEGFATVAQRSHMSLVARVWGRLLCLGVRLGRWFSRREIKQPAPEQPDTLALPAQRMPRLHDQRMPRRRRGEFREE